MFATLDLGIRRLPLQQSLKLGRGLNHQVGYKELGWTTTAPLLSFKFGQMLLLIGSSGYNHVSCHCQSAIFVLTGCPNQQDIETSFRTSRSLLSCDKAVRVPTWLVFRIVKIRGLSLILDKVKKSSSPFFIIDILRGCYYWWSEGEISKSNRDGWDIDLIAKWKGHSKISLPMDHVVS
ncbi:hypothetical protein V6N13_123376 [Hibiscus sabdariffa]|uniref:Uncharacterized protein n=1 Tax=Hibiscus sabdariffa TaxID=183260 RepID=A0ABR2AXE4_9ROSI